MVGACVPLGNYRQVGWKEILYRNEHPNSNSEVENMIRKLMRVALVRSYDPLPIFWTRTKFET